MFTLLTVDILEEDNRIFLKYEPKFHMLTHHHANLFDACPLDLFRPVAEPNLTSAELLCLNAGMNIYHLNSLP